MSNLSEEPESLLISTAKQSSPIICNMKNKKRTLLMTEAKTNNWILVRGRARIISLCYVPTLLGRVRSIVNYDKTYGIFLRGFANKCAVSNSVIYDRALLWWSTGTLVELTDASVTDIDRKGNRLMPFRFFFFFIFLRPPSLLLCLFLSMKEIKNKLSTDSPCFGPLSVGWSKRNHSRTCEDRPYFRRWSWKLRRGEDRWKGFSCVVIFVMKWSSTKNHRSLIDLSGVGAGEEQEKYSRYPKKVDWAAKKWIFDRRGKLSLGCCAIGHERKEN